MIPQAPQPKPAMKPMNGTVSMPHEGLRPKTMPTSSGTLP
jgi:hypothetical protein